MARYNKQVESFLDREAVEDNRVESEVETESDEEVVMPATPVRRKKNVQQNNNNVKSNNPTPSTSSAVSRKRKVNSDAEFELILDNPEMDDSEKITNKIRLGKQTGKKFILF